MSQLRYSERQIMPILADSLVDTLGLDDDEALDPVTDLDRRIDQYLKDINEWNAFDFADFIYVIERLFHFECSPKEWKAFFGVDCGYQSEEEWVEQVGLHLTFKALVEFIAARAPYVSFQPVTVIDRACGPAGAFYGLEELSGKYFSATCRVTPSTQLLDAFRGRQLEKFWGELQWRSGAKLTDLKSFWFLLEGCGCLMFFLALFIAVVIFLPGGDYLALTVTLLSAYTVWRVISVCCYWSNPLPPELQTFRDLAVLIANHDGESVRLPANVSSSNN